MALRRSMTLFVTIVVLIIVALFVEHHDAALMGEIKIMLTIMFGLATSILLFVFIWLVQRESINGLGNGLNLGHLDAPSMHPRGRSSSMQSMADDSRNMICSISHQTDKPPNYEDALISSKPIYWTNNIQRKEAGNSDLNQTHQLVDCTGLNLCPLHSSHTTQPDTNISSGGREHCTCPEDINVDPNKSGRKSSTGIQVARIARNFIRGLTSQDALPHQSNIMSGPIENQMAHQMTDSRQSEGDDPNRKLSYQQLDVSQLSVSCSPPKYGDLVLNGQLDGMTSDELQRMC